MKISDIHGMALDALAARAYGLPVEDTMLCSDRQACLVYLPTVERGHALGIDVEDLTLGEFRVYAPSSNWLHAGALSDLEDISVDRSGDPASADRRPYAYVPGAELDGQYGDTAKEAITRCFVAYRLGAEIPEEWSGKLNETPA